MGDRGTGKSKILKRFTQRMRSSSTTVLHVEASWATPDALEYCRKSEAESSSKSCAEVRDVADLAMRQGSKPDVEDGGVRDALTAMWGLDTLGCWFKVITSWLQANVTSNSCLVTAYQTRILKLIGDKSLRKFAAVLNFGLDLKFTCTGQSRKDLVQWCADDTQDRAGWRKVVNMQMQLVQAIVLGIAKRESRLVIILDQGENMDGLSLRLVRKLSRLLPSLGVMIVVGMRAIHPDAPPKDQSTKLALQIGIDLAHERRELVHEACVETLQLGPLNDVAAARLACTQFGSNVFELGEDMKEYICRSSGGNPVAVKHLVQVLKESTNPTLLSVVELAITRNIHGTPADNCLLSPHQGAADVHGGRVQWSPSTAGETAVSMVRAELAVPLESLLGVPRPTLKLFGYTSEASAMAAANTTRQQQEQTPPHRQTNDGVAPPTAKDSHLKEEEENEGTNRLSAAIPVDLQRKLAASDIRGLEYCNDTCNAVAISAPLHVRLSLGADIDRLSSLEQLVLTVASVIGDTFSLEHVQLSYPVAGEPMDKHKLMKVCDGLADVQGILHKLYNKLGKQSR
jgi:hypothetical protein